MTVEQFYNQITSLSDNYENRDLEEYLKALLKLVLDDTTAHLTAEYLIELLEKAFTSEPVSIEPEWLLINNAPTAYSLKQKITEANNLTLVNNLQKQYTIEIIKFQIAELIKMANDQLKNKMRYFGVQSQTSNFWYNFDPYTNLECGARCLLDSSTNEANEFYCNWAALGELLEMGRIYE